MKRLSAAAVVPLMLAISVSACSWLGKPPEEVGMMDDRLRPCPDSPNCVCSEYPDDEAYIAPFEYSGPADRAWEAVRRAVVESGGTVDVMRDDYLRATFTTAVLRFVDDVELRLQVQHNRIHVRSASRAGYYDFGVNRRRVERLRAAFQAAAE